MSYRVRVILDIDWVPDGAGGALLGQNQSNDPGYGSALGPGAVGASQTLRLMVAEQVPGAAAPSQANFNTAIGAAAADLETLMGTAGAWGGNSGTPLAIALAWATGGP